MRERSKLSTLAVEKGLTRPAPDDTYTFTPFGAPANDPASLMFILQLRMVLMQQATLGGQRVRGIIQTLTAVQGRRLCEIRVHLTSALVNISIGLATRKSAAALRPTLPRNADGGHERGRN